MKRIMALSVLVSGFALAASAGDAPELKVYASARGGNAGTDSDATTAVTLTWTVSDYGTGASSTGPVTLELSETSDFAAKTEVEVAASASGTLPVSGTYKVTDLTAGAMRYARIRATNDRSVEGASLVFPFSSLTSKSSPDWVSRGTVRHVDNVNGSDETGDGSAAHPYATLARAAYHACQFDRIVIRPGRTYALTSPIVFPNIPTDKQYTQLTIESAIEGEHVVIAGDGTCILMDAQYGAIYYKDICFSNGVSAVSGCGGAVKAFANAWGGRNEPWRLTTRFDRCRFTGCSNTVAGAGALYVRKSIFNDCEFVNNCASLDAGALYLNSAGNGRVVNELYRCHFIGNVAGLSGSGGGNGGAVDCASYGTQEFYDCTFVSNRTVSTKSGDCHAGAINNAVTLVSNCTFFANHAPAGGGAVYARNADVSILDSKFFENHVYGGGDNNYNGGGAVYVWSDKSPTIRGCLFAGNTSTNQAGGALTCGNCAALSDCVFSNNWSDSSFAAVRVRGNAALIERCSFVDNRTSGDGGVMGFASGNANTLAMRNCLFARNEAGGNGGALAFSNWSKANTSIVESCTFVANTAGAKKKGAAIYAKNDIMSVTNCLFSANTVGTTEGVAYADTGASVTLDHCFTEGDPKFVDAAAGDYMLKVTSPCRNAGVNQPWMADATDLAKRPKKGRIAEGIVDVGCYECWPNLGLLLLFR